MLLDSKLLLLISATIIAGILEYLALAGIRLPQPIATPFFLIFILSMGYSTLRHGFLALIRLNFKSINALMLIAVAGAWYLGKYEEACVVIVLYTLAEKLEEVGIEKSQSALSSLIEQMPRFVQLNNQNEKIPVDQVQKNEIFIVKPGEMIPLDGKIVSGNSYVDESTITGEPLPQDKTTGDDVYAGTLNKHGYLEIKVSKTSNDTTFAKIKELTYEATQNKAPTEKFIEKFSEYYTPLIIILAFLLVFIPVVFLGYPFNPVFAQALTLIVIACPCALVISTPVSIYSAIGNASKEGVLIKGGKYIEAIGQVKAIAFDKTRTLTYGRPIVSEVIPYENNSQNDVLECAAGIEIFSEHPLAQSIVEYAKNQNLTFHKIENFKSFVGKGGQADCLICDSAHHCIGKLSFILEHHPVPQKIIDEIEELQKLGKTPVVIANHHEIEGVIALSDEIRPESFPLIRQLHKLKIDPILLTGDHVYAAEKVASELGIKEYKADLLPTEKGQEIEKLVRRYNSVAMVGDGVNDAPALASSTVGISFGSLGSDTAIEAASIVILNDRLEVIPYLVQLGKRTIQTIQFNTALAILVKLFFIFLALMGMSNLAFAIFADVGITLIVILISLRLLKRQK